MNLKEIKILPFPLATPIVGKVVQILRPPLSYNQVGGLAHSVSKPSSELFPMFLPIDCLRQASSIFFNQEFFLI